MGECPILQEEELGNTYNTEGLPWEQSGITTPGTAALGSELQLWGLKPSIFCISDEKLGS